MVEGKPGHRTHLLANTQRTNSLDALDIIQLGHRGIQHIPKTAVCASVRITAKKAGSRKKISKLNLALSQIISVTEGPTQGATSRKLAKNHHSGNIGVLHFPQRRTDQAQPRNTKPSHEANNLPQGPHNTRDMICSDALPSCST